MGRAKSTGFSEARRETPLAPTSDRDRNGWTAAIGIEPQTHISRHERTLGRH